MDVAGIVLCGGESRRMGCSKATLPFGDEVMLARVLRLLRTIVRPLVVVAASGQQLPPLADDIQIVRDRVAGRGPLEGLYCGLSALGQSVAAAYATACDVPLLKPAFVEYLIEQLGDHDVVVPVEGTFHYPLSAVYRTRVVGRIAELLARDQLRMIGFYDQVSTRRIDVAELKAVDPLLRSLMNLNRPEDYQAALELVAAEDDRPG